MSSNARYVRGDCAPKPVLCDPAYPIEIGDLLFREPSNNLARPASAMIAQGSLALNQGAFHDQFLGVALQKNGLQNATASGGTYSAGAITAGACPETVPLHSTLDHQPPNVIMVATQGIFVFPVAGGTYQFNGGEFVGPSGAAADVGSTSGAEGSTLKNQVVEKVASAGLSVGRASPSAAAIGATMEMPEGQPVSLVDEVEVEILSTIFYGGAQAFVAGTSSGAV